MERPANSTNKPANKPVNKPANNKPANKQVNKPVNKPANKPANTTSTATTATATATATASTSNAAKKPGIMNRFKALFGQNKAANSNNVVPKNLANMGVTNNNVLTKMKNKGLTNTQIQNLLKNPELRKSSAPYISAINNIRKNYNMNNDKSNAYGTSYASYVMLPVAVIGMIIFLLFGLTYFVKTGEPPKK